MATRTWSDEEVEVAELIQEYVQADLVGHRFYLEDGQVAKIRHIAILVEDFDAEWSDV